MVVYVVPAPWLWKRVVKGPPTGRFGAVQVRVTRQRSSSTPVTVAVRLLGASSTSGLDATDEARTMLTWHAGSVLPLRQLAKSTVECVPVDVTTGAAPGDVSDPTPAVGLFGALPHAMASVRAIVLPIFSRKGRRDVVVSMRPRFAKSRERLTETAGTEPIDGDTQLPQGDRNFRLTSRHGGILLLDTFGGDGILVPSVAHHETCGLDVESIPERPNFFPFVRLLSCIGPSCRPDCLQQLSPVSRARVGSPAGPP
jgi:hypothetical protein